MENWRDIKGFDGYQVSDKGRVRTHNKITSNRRFPCREWQDRILKQKISKLDGRARVCMWANGKEHTFLVHRIMAVTFLGEPSAPNMTVNHIDGNPLNNVIENIEWVTRAENIKLAFKNGQYSTVKPTTIIGTDGESLNFSSMSDCDRFLNRKVGYTSNRLQTNRPLKSRSGEVYIGAK